MKIAYRLEDNPAHIAQVQKATLTTDNFGIEPTHGLFGSPEWWGRIARGDLHLHTLHGVITECFMGSMGDWPMIRVHSASGEESEWTREANNREQAALYRSGRHIEIDYVLQRHRRKSSGFDMEHNIVIEIRIEPRPSGESPGSHEKLRAKEIARGVITQPFWMATEVSHELADLGRTPRVMSRKVHQVFLDAAADIDRRMCEIPKGPDAQKRIDVTLIELHERWKDAILDACKKILDEQCA